MNERRRLVRPGEQYVAGEDVELEPAEPGEVELAEEDQGDEPGPEVPF
jgi:hypothetical protein